MYHNGDGDSMRTTTANKYLKKMTFTIHRSFIDIARNYDAFILDQYGVMHNGQQSLPGAVECVEKLSSMGKKLIILSNTSAPADTALSKLPKLGFDPDCFVGAVTSGEEASRFIREELFRNEDNNNSSIASTKKKAIFLTWKDDSVSDQFIAKCGNIEPTSNFDEADVIIAHGSEVLRTESSSSHVSLGSFVDDGDLTLIHPILKQCQERNIPMICANPDFIVKVGFGKDGSITTITITQKGKIAHHYEQMGGQCKNFGKPREEHFYACLRELNLDANRVAHVGDSLHHDIAGANAAGISNVFITG